MKETVRKTSSGNEYIVKSVFVGDKDIKTVILNLAEKKALKEMGLEIIERELNK